MILELRPKYPQLPLIRMCQLLGVSRSAVYRKPSERSERSRFYRELRLEIACVLGIHPGYGYRRVRLALAQKGVACGYKSVAKAMKEAGFGIRRRFRPKTSDGKGRARENLLKSLKVDGPGQAWVADITYIPLPGRFAYLACILDVFLRRIVGSAMGSRIDRELTLAALEAALAKYPPEPGWIHHSDRGSQYLSKEYASAVEQAAGRLSCSAKGCPYDNAMMESFFKTLKAEEVWLEDYQDLAQAKQRVQKFIANYNANRLHSSLGYKSPDQFEAQFRLHDQR